MGTGARAAILLLVVLFAWPAVAQEEPEPAWVSLRRRRGAGKLRTLGGTGATENAVELGLAWLASHQDDDGRWDCDGFMKHDPPDDMTNGPGGKEHDVAVTALSVLAFLGAGYADGDDDSDGANRYAARVRAALGYLRRAQAEDGAFGARTDRKWIYGHVFATAALAEAYGLRRDAAYRQAAQRGLDLLVAGRGPGGGWRYTLPARESDTSVTAWCVVALHAGVEAGLRVDPAALAGARAWFELMTDPETGHAGYRERGGPPFRPPELRDRFPAQHSPATTAAALYGRLLAGEPAYRKGLKQSIRLCAEHAPNWNPDSGSIDLTYWFFGTYALGRVGGGPWAKWNKSLRHVACQHQHLRGSGARTGSWDPIGVWGADGGRVYATALMTLTLEAYYRWPRK